MGFDDDLGPLLEPGQAEELERRDRDHPGPGHEPPCPVCGEPVVRRVEEHPAPRADDSPFRIRLVCSDPDCRAWTVYDW